MEDLVKKYGKTKPPTLEQKVTNLINECLKILIEDKKEVAMEKLFDFSILNDLPIKNKIYYQDFILNWKCEEFERKEYLKDDNNIK